MIVNKNVNKRKLPFVIFAFKIIDKEETEKVKKTMKIEIESSLR